MTAWCKSSSHKKFNWIYTSPREPLCTAVTGGFKSLISFQPFHFKEDVEIQHFLELGEFINLFVSNKNFSFFVSFPPKPHWACSSGLVFDRLQKRRSTGFPRKISIIRAICQTTPTISSSNPLLKSHVKLFDCKEGKLVFERFDRCLGKLCKTISVILSC